MTANVEANVSGIECDAVLNALREKLGTLEPDYEIDTTNRIYASGEVRIVINSGIQDGFISVSIASGAAPWNTDVDLARFLAKRLSCRVRCSPPVAEYPQINPYSDSFLEIDAGRESIVQWGPPGKEHLRQRYDGLFDRVAAILCEEDPVDLVRSCVPKDEYEPEAGTILPRLETAKTVHDVENIIHEEFCDWFGTNVAGPRENYRSAAAKIWEEWRKSSPL